MDSKKSYQPERLRRIGIRLVLFCSAFLLFCVITFFVMRDGVTPLDQALCSRIYAMRTETLTAVLKAITYLGNWQTVTLICIALLFFQKTRRHFGVPLATSCITSTLLYEVLKRIFQRPRPDLSLHLITQGGYSFPSGHSMTGLVFYGLLIVLLWHHVRNPKARAVFTAGFTLLFLTIGFSRVYLGVHYPTDVLGGWSLGLCILLAFSEELEQRWATRRKYAL